MFVYRGFSRDSCYGFEIKVKKIYIYNAKYIVMTTDLSKKNMPELLTDWNGHPVQAWILGGRTITISRGQFACESTLMRLCNTGSSVARIKLAGAAWDKLVKDGGDVGMPILPNESIVVGVMKAGQVYEVEGTLDVTFFYDRRVRNSADIPEYPEFSASTISQIKYGEEASQIEGNVITFSGLIPYSFESVALGRKAGNRVGVRIEPSMDVKKFPDAMIYFINPQDNVNPKVFAVKDVLEKETEEGPSIINYWPLIKYIPFEAKVYIKWLPSDQAYDESFTIEIKAESGNSLQIG